VTSLSAGVVDFSAADLVDVDRRPCGELASARYDEGATEVVACPYHGVRSGLPMNRTALRQISSAWPALVGSARALVDPEEPTVYRAFRAAVAGTAAPLAFHAASPDQPIPRVLSAFFKASLGFSQVLSALLLADDGVADAALSDLGDGDAFLAYLEHERWLVGQLQVCAGPEPMIRQMFEAFAGISGEPRLAPEFGDPATYADVAVEAIGVQAAYLLMTRERTRAGEPPRGTDGERWLANTPQPWLRAIRMAPNRAPEHALRLFPAGRVPPSVQRVLAADSDLEAVFRAALP
jgi:hypothetical protein